jgi:hypothetical protein
MNFFAPKILLHLEGLAVLIAATLVYARSGHDWRWFWLTFLVPDVALFGYLAGNRVGAACYNAVHTYVAPLLLAALLVATGGPAHLWITWVWSAHIGMDRLLGYGLKYGSAARDTHLSRV